MLSNRSSHGSVGEEIVKEVDEDSKLEVRKYWRRAVEVVDSCVKCSALLGVAAFVGQKALEVKEVDLPLIVQWLNTLMKGLFCVGMAVAAFSVNRTKRLIKGPKLYWSDPALALWLSGAKEMTGAHLENLVFVDLLVWREGQVPAPEVLFWRTTTDREVDFVIESGDRLLAVEVKAAAPRYADTIGLRLFRDEYPDQFVGGLLLHGGGEILQMSDGIIAAPWWRVL